MANHIYYKTGYKYQLCREHTELVSIFLDPHKPVETDYLKLADGWLTIKKGYAWDGASGPTVDSKSSMRGSLVHDALYQIMRLGLLSETYRKQADKLLHDICTADGMNPIRADLWRDAVHLLAGRYAKRGTEQRVLVAP